MDAGDPIVAVLMCHAPIVIPPIGGERGTECAATTAAMREAGRIVAASGAETAIIFSPHLPRHRESFGVVAMEKLQGDFGTFGRPGIGCAFRGDAAAGAALRRTAPRSGLNLDPVEIRGLDHGTLVPLWFLQEAGFRGRILVIGFPWYTSPAANRAFGQALRETMAGLHRRWALVASGDMSHALKPGAPSGFHPRAQAFDDAVVEALRSGTLGKVGAIPEDLRDLAAEDVIDSLETATGVLGEAIPADGVLSYEGPFGVGYLVATLKGIGA
jgi:aromatic ring-opening dioxygenase LigB subunit